MRLAILGCGLLGASVASAARKFGVAEHIVGFDVHAASVAAARACGAFDAVYTLAAGAAPTTPDTAPFDLGIVAVPPAHLAAGVRRLAPVCSAVADVGSVKQPLLEELGADLPAHFVPCHPMAGSERAGAAAANADLFQQRWVLLTPTTAVAPAALHCVTSFWRALGARTLELDAAKHDEAVAYTSHLPHLLAFTYMGLLDVPSAAVGPGFRDFSRLALANPALWSDILLSNRAAWRPLLRDYISRLQEVDTLLATGDGAAVAAYLAARRDNRALLDEVLDSGVDEVMQ